MLNKNEMLKQFSEEKDYTSKEVAIGLGMSITCLLKIKKKLSLDLLQIKKYFYWNKQDIELLVNSNFFDKYYSFKESRKIKNKFQKDYEPIILEWCVPEEHPLVTDKRFLNLITFPTKEEITPKSFMELED